MPTQAGRGPILACNTDALGCSQHMARKQQTNFPVQPYTVQGNSGRVRAASSGTNRLPLVVNEERLGKVCAAIRAKRATTP